jgi:hypothetical protein
MSRDMASKLVEEKGSSREHRFCALIERSSDDYLPRAEEFAEIGELTGIKL